MPEKLPPDVIEVKVPAKADYVAVVRLLVSGLANRMGFAYDDIEDVKVAVTEACTNVVTHAYLEADENIHIECKVYHDRLCITVADKGAIFNIEQIENQIGPIDAKQPFTAIKEGGLGIHLMKSLMDRVNITSREGVVVRMTKLLQRDEVERHAHTATEPPRSS